MFPDERRKYIVDVINKNGSVRVSDIAKSLSVTPETIRKDITFLDSNGLVRKQFGGATAVVLAPEVTVQTRLAENVDAKARIAAKAMEYISGEILFLDAGSTLIALAKNIASKSGHIILTNSFTSANELIESPNTIMFLGGEVSSTTSATFGAWTTNMLNQIQIDIAFLGTSGFMSQTGPCAKSFNDTDTKRAIVRCSAKRIVLADSSKFQTRAISPYCDWRDIDVLITDTDAPIAAVNQLRKQVEVILV